MRVLHVSKYDVKGGASRAAYTSVIGQRHAGIQSEMLVGLKESDSEFVHAPSGIKRLAILAGFLGEKLPLLVTWNRTDVRSLHLFGLSASWIERHFKPDIVIAHKIDGILPVRELSRLKVPLIWRLHDMWPICGTRHYALEDQVLRQEPSEWPLPFLDRALEAVVWKLKKHAYDKLNKLVICTPSRWLAECVQASPLFGKGCHIEVVPNGVDTNIFRPQSQILARSSLNLPLDRSIILFGAAGGTFDVRKGFDLLLQALHKLPDDSELRPYLLVFGDKLPPELSKTGLDVKSVGKIEDNKRLARVYAAADAFVAPSRQENLSLTVLESLSCGTPVIAFNVGGMPDMIAHGHNGWLAKPFSTTDFMNQIRAALRLTEPERNSFRHVARKTIVDRFSMEVEASEMQKLMNQTLATYTS